LTLAGGIQAFLSTRATPQLFLALARYELQLMML
jgi:hypothetical protein